jgi:hypothetical protein
VRAGAPADFNPPNLGLLATPALSNPYEEALRPRLLASSPGLSAVMIAPHQNEHAFPASNHAIGAALLRLRAETDLPLEHIMPFDVAVLQHGMERFLEQFESLAASPRGPDRTFLPSWLVTAVAAGFAWAVVHRQRKARERQNTGLRESDGVLPLGSEDSW